MQLDGLAFDQHGSNAWMPRRCSVGAQFSRPDARGSPLRGCPTPPASPSDHLRRLDGGGDAHLRACSKMNGLNSSSAIFFGRPHWCSFSCGPTTMTERPGVVDALAEQVLAEPAALALDHVGQRLQRALVGAGHGLAATAVVEQASTASCSMRFSLRTMMSGALSSSRRFRRLLRLMTRRYRSFRSESRSGRRPAAPAGAGPAAVPAGLRGSSTPA